MLEMAIPRKCHEDIGDCEKQDEADKIAGHTNKEMSYLYAFSGKNPDNPVGDDRHFPDGVMKTLLTSLTEA